MLGISTLIKWCRWWTPVTPRSYSSCRPSWSTWLTKLNSSFKIIHSSASSSTFWPNCRCPSNFNHNSNLFRQQSPLRNNKVKSICHRLMCGILLRRLRISRSTPRRFNLSPWRPKSSLRSLYPLFYHRTWLYRPTFRRWSWSRPGFVWCHLSLGVHRCTTRCRSRSTSPSMATVASRTIKPVQLRLRISLTCSKSRAKIWKIFLSTCQ